MRRFFEIDISSSCFRLSFVIEVMCFFYPPLIMISALLYVAVISRAVIRPASPLPLHLLRFFDTFSIVAIL